MMERQEDVFYYLTVENEPYVMPAMGEGMREGILKGLYRFRTMGADGDSATVKLLPSGHDFFVAGQDSILESAVKSGVHLKYGCASGN